MNPDWFRNPDRMDCDIYFNLDESGLPIRSWYSKVFGRKRSHAKVSEQRSESLGGFAYARKGSSWHVEGSRFTIMHDHQRLIGNLINERFNDIPSETRVSAVHRSFSSSSHVYSLISLIRMAIGSGPSLRYNCVYRGEATRAFTSKWVIRIAAATVREPVDIYNRPRKWKSTDACLYTRQHFRINILTGCQEWG